MSGRRVIGIDVGGTKLLGGVVDERLAVHHRVRRRSAGLATRELLDTIVEAVDELRAAAPDVAAVGLGVPARVDVAAGVAVGAVHLPLDDVPLRDVLSERLGLPVAVDNDANAAALAEHRHGAARGARHAVLLTIGTGIGGGLVLDGSLYRGAGGAAAELGHVTVDADGPPCQGSCPGRGCLETLVSGSAIGRAGAAAAEREPDSALGRARAAGREVTGPLVTELAHDGDAAARAVLAEAGRWLGIGIASFANAFDPEVVVVGGGAVAAGDLLLAPARAEVAARALAPARDRVRVVAAHFGDESGMLGAGLLALDAAPGGSR